MSDRHYPSIVPPILDHQGDTYLTLLRDALFLSRCLDLNVKPTNVAYQRFKTSFIKRVVWVRPSHDFSLQCPSDLDGFAELSSQPEFDAPLLTDTPDAPPILDLSYSLNLGGLLGPHACEAILHFLLPSDTITPFKTPVTPLNTSEPLSARPSYKPLLPSSSSSSSPPLPRSPLLLLHRLLKRCSRAWNIDFKPESDLPRLAAPDSAPSEALDAVASAFADYQVDDMVSTDMHLSCVGWVAAMMGQTQTHEQGEMEEKTEGHVDADAHAESPPQPIPASSDV